MDTMKDNAIPLLAITALGVATGGFGIPAMMGIGGTTGAGTAAVAGAGTTAATTAIGAGASEAANLAAGELIAGKLTEIGAVKAAEAATAKTMLGLTAGQWGMASSLASTSTGLMQADAAKKASEFKIAQAAEGAKYAAAQDALDLAVKERQNQERTSRVLASQNNFFEAAGIVSNAGSAKQAALGVASDAVNQSGMLQTLQNTSSSNYGYALNSQNAALKSTASKYRNQQIGVEVGSLLDFGMNWG